MEDIVSKRSKIEIQVGLNANNLPLEMHWSASDGQIENSPAKAQVVSVVEAPAAGAAAP